MRCTTGICVCILNSFNEDGMCFSAEVSFISSGVLAVTGLFCIKKSHEAKHYWLLAITPFLFALQQFLEGFVWIGINHHYAFLTHIFSVAFLFFAFFFWVTWFPIVAYSLEDIPWKKHFFVFLIAVGIVFGLYLWLPVFLEEGPRRLIATEVCKNSLCYAIASGGYLASLPRAVIYFSLGVLYLVCSDRLFKKFWVVVMFFAGITMIIYEFALTSVWCFFSAMASLLIIYLINELIHKR